MINALTSENYRFIKRVLILNSKQVFYPLKYGLEGRDITFDEDDALIVKPIIEDVKYPATVKIGDAGQLWEYKLEFSINSQDAVTSNQLYKLINKKVIVVLEHPEGRFIIGTNEFPLSYIFADDNSTNPATSNGFSVECRGNSYISKVSV